MMTHKLSGRQIMILSCLLATSATVSGCTGLFASAAATGGIAIAQERSPGHAVDDTIILTKISHKFFETGTQDLFVHIGIDVLEGRVLLTGNAPTPEVMIDAVRLTWQVDGVTEVINEIQVTNNNSIQDFAKDTFITAQIKSKLLLDKEIRSINYNVETVNGVVYLIGIAQNQTELDRVSQIASTTKNVRKVISHVRLKDDPKRRT